ncbi:MAG: Hpt domain-containing protein [Phycisphaerae bacterium]|nr:Hpt domain-containing protein [Phycisphaerae bacterium]
MRITADQPFVYSVFAGDAEMKEIIAMFVHELPKRTMAMQAALNAADLELVRILAHQLKGAAGGYGFASLGDAAALVEAGVKDGCEANVIRSRIGTLIAMAARVRA